jgi:hypothetical protein
VRSIGQLLWTTQGLRVRTFELSKVDLAEIDASHRSVIIRVVYAYLNEQGPKSKSSPCRLWVDAVEKGVEEPSEQ